MFVGFLHLAEILANNGAWQISRFNADCNVIVCLIKLIKLVRKKRKRKKEKRGYIDSIQAISARCQTERKSKTVLKRKAMRKMLRRGGWLSRKLDAKLGPGKRRKKMFPGWIVPRRRQKCRTSG